MDNDVILYTTDDGEFQLALRELGGQVGLTLLDMAELYQTSKQNISKQNISKHVKAVLSDGELAEGAVVKAYRTKLYALIGRSTGD